MDNIFLLLFLLSPVALIIGLIKPSFVNRYLKRELTRGKMTVLFSTLTIIFLVLFGITTDTTSVKQANKENNPESQQVSKNQEVKGESSTAETPSQQEGTQDEEPIAKDDSKQVGIKVVKVIDGDTIEIDGGARVRYIGIDTPETVSPTSAIECYGKESSNKNRELVEGKTVRLEKDVSEIDKYGRLLRYVYVGDIFVNDYLVRQGFANASSYPPDVKYQSQFIDAEREARENNRGLWGVCKGSSQSAPKQDTTQTPVSKSGNCDASYPTVCIPPPPPDLDCKDISYRRFKVVSPDSHNFDGQDNDGIGCESL